MSSNSLHRRDAKAAVLGPGLLESIYQHALQHEPALRKLPAEEVHRAQLLTYLRLSGLQAGLIINFNVMTLRDGMRRVANALRPFASSAPLR